MSQSMIQVSGLVYEYSGFRALNGISFDIPQGSITALVGPNGAGKTTLMKCLTALLSPLKGTIHIDGIDVQEHPLEVHRRVGFLPDFFGLYDGLTVEQTLKHACLAREVPLQEVPERLATTLAQVNLTDKKKNSVTELSRGMKQRLAIAQSIIHKPRLLILDEPASGLDPEARASLSALFKSLNKEGMTILVSSHILAELDQYANHLLSLRQGELAQNQSSLKGIERRLIVKLGTLSASQKEQFQTLAGKSQEKDGHHYLNFSGGETEQMELLKKLIQAGIPVAEYFVERDGLQRQYLNQIQ